MKNSTIAAARSAKSMLGAKYTGAIALPMGMKSHPAIYAAPTETYENPSEVGGWHYVIESTDRSWIAFVDVAGKSLLCTKRDPDGGVIGVPYIFQRPDLAIPGAIQASRRIQFARSVEASSEGEAPNAARLWKAGWNRTDKGDLNFTPRSAKLVLQAYQDRNNGLAWYYEHEDRLPLEKRGGAPMKGVCSAPSSALTVRDSDEGPECWAESIAWTDEAKRQIQSGERRQLSPIASFDSDTREIVEILNVSLCAEGATLSGTILASAGKGMMSMDDMIQALLDALNAGDFEAAENIVQQMEAQEGGGAMAKMARGMMAKMGKEDPAPAPAAAPPPAPEDTAKKQLAASREYAAQFQSAEFSRGMERLEAATNSANAAAAQSRRATVLTMIASRRECFDAVDEREHLTAADPAATEKHIASMTRKGKAAGTSTLAASRAPTEARPPKDASSVDETHGLSIIEIQTAGQSGIPLADFAASKKRMNDSARARGKVQ